MKDEEKKDAEKTKKAEDGTEDKEDGAKSEDKSDDQERKEGVAGADKDFQ